ncbi:hypothetical protein [Pontibacter flavimaris]|nr:hypothetical protein [Pontibacter flavimaris]
MQTKRWNRRVVILGRCTWHPNDLLTLSCEHLYFIRRVFIL